LSSLIRFFQLCGLSDANKTFFPTAVAISSQEDTWSYGSLLHSVSTWEPEKIYEPRLLVADGATTITNGKPDQLG
jgi:hypothetical protein